MHTSYTMENPFSAETSQKVQGIIQISESRRFKFDPGPRYRTTLQQKQYLGTCKTHHAGWRDIYVTMTSHITL